MIIGISLIIICMFPIFRIILIANLESFNVKIPRIKTKIFCPKNSYEGRIRYKLVKQEYGDRYVIIGYMTKWCIDSLNNISISTFLPIPLYIDTLSEIEVYSMWLTEKELNMFIDDNEKFIREFDEKVIHSIKYKEDKLKEKINIKNKMEEFNKKQK